MTWAATAIGGASALATGYMSYEGGKNQADAQKQAAQIQANEFQQAIEQYQQAQAKSAPMYTPWLTAGTNAQNTLSQLTQPGGYLYNAPDMTNFRKDPQWQNSFNNAMKAIQSSQAARGGLYSGQSSQDLINQAMAQADNEYQTIYARKTGEQNTLATRLGNLSQGGFNVANTLSNLNTGTASNIGTTLGEIGNVQGAGITGAAGARASGNMGIMNAINSGMGLGLNQYNAGQQNQNWQKLLNQLNQGNNPSNTSSLMNPMNTNLDMNSDSMYRVSP
jgi:hypothetical protein